MYIYIYIKKKQERRDNYIYIGGSLCKGGHFYNLKKTTLSITTKRTMK